MTTKSCSAAGAREPQREVTCHAGWRPNGYKVDIAHNSCIDGYVKSAFSYIGLRGDGYPQWKAASGNLYCDEGNHWDITYYTSGG